MTNTPEKPAPDAAEKPGVLTDERILTIAAEHDYADEDPKCITRLARAIEREVTARLAAPAAVQAVRVPDLHNAIMNLPCDASPYDHAPDERLAYKIGHRDARHAAAELVATQAVRVPEGWKLVPIEPTDDMKTAGFAVATSSRLRATNCYAAMLAAAPAAPTAPAEPGKWNVLAEDDKPDASRLLDVILYNGVCLMDRQYSKIDWSAVRDWRYSATPTTTAAPAQAAGEEVRELDRLRADLMRATVSNALALHRLKKSAINVCRRIETGAMIDNDKTPSSFKDGMAKGANDCATAIAALRLPAGDSKGEQ